MSSPYDSPTPGAVSDGPNKSKLVQQQVDEVVNIMQDNVNQVMERGERLDTLNHKAEDLESGALQFRRGANKVRKNMWWKNCKLKLIIIAVLIILLLVIIIPLVTRKN
ncbi:synaptobrevin [Basidiobolus meristosporus CBS 931.73]|uniref:Synaptobrevin n=1 Tax=Basidiobolus meristosporus CBS 931.73 TaxID=1314790 RepID=A0A1Y1XPC9_9FUNG|nr:synaptobrevin [Basidiobolus meristosporus CBS 931.73]|eukprot:ORX87525.1 synaptobrevin [Basidiobolus meristosporus CBS 931.73]